MKIIPILLILILSSCSNLSDEEISMVGYWEYNVGDNDYQESGYLDLRENRTYSYKIESNSTTEKITQGQKDYDGFWRVNNEYICIAKRWNGSTTFENCLWEIEVSKNNQKSLILKNSNFGGKVKLTLIGYKT